MARYDWPGNVRELRNYVERCLALREAAPTLPDPHAAKDAPAPDAAQPLRAARESSTREFEARYLADLLERHQGNVSAAARAAGVDRKYLYRLLWRNGLR
jgi:two-component system, NtrC family, response regulator GlrR